MKKNNVLSSGSSSSTAHAQKQLPTSDVFKKKLAQSFIPYARALAAAWKMKSVDDKKHQESQELWGKNNMICLYDLSQWIDKQAKKPSSKELYTRAAKLRAHIAKTMRKEEGYASPRFHLNDDLQKSGRPLTAMFPNGRYADQLSEALNVLSVLPDNDACLRREVHFLKLSGHPRVQCVNDKGVVSTPEIGEESLRLEVFQHYFIDGDEKIPLSEVRHFHWYAPQVGQPVEYIDFASPLATDLEKVFEYLDKMQLRLWEDSSLNDDQFYEKLADMMWLYAQATFLENGSASTSELIMKTCLIRRFGENAPLFSKPGLSIDILAIICTQNQFRKCFKNMLQMDPPSQQQIQEGYDVDPSFTRIYHSKQYTLAQIEKRNKNQEMTGAEAAFIRDGEFVSLAFAKDVKSSQELIDQAILGVYGKSMRNGYKN